MIFLFLTTTFCKICGVLSNIFKKKSNALYLYSNNIEDKILKKIKLSNSIIIEDLEESFDEKLLYSIFNLVEQDNKYLLISSKKPFSSTFLIYFFTYCPDLE